MQVLAGDHKRSQREETRHIVGRVYEHPNYRAGSKRHLTNYDYAIIELQCNSEILLQGNANAVCLPDMGDAEKYKLIGTKFNISGWGSTRHINGYTSNTLKVVQVPFKPHSQCKWNGLTDQMICAGETTEGNG